MIALATVCDFLCLLNAIINEVPPPSLPSRSLSLSRRSSSIFLKKEQKIKKLQNYSVQMNTQIRKNRMAGIERYEHFEVLVGTDQRLGSSSITKWKRSASGERIFRTRRRCDGEVRESPPFHSIPAGDNESLVTKRKKMEGRKEDFLLKISAALFISCFI